MSTSSKIKDNIRTLGANVIFASKQLLHLGTRNAVDLALSRLEKKGFIKRLALGVFIAASSAQGLTLPSAVEIANLKAEIFGKQISFNNDDPDEIRNFCTNGCSSSFQTIHGRVIFKSISPNKLCKLTLQNKLSGQQNDSKRSTDMSKKELAISMLSHGSSLSLSHSNSLPVFCSKIRQFLKRLAIPGHSNKNSIISIVLAREPKLELPNLIKIESLILFDDHVMAYVPPW